MFPPVSLTTTVLAVLAVEVSYPSNKSAFRLVTLVVDATTNGAIPVAVLDIKV